VFLGRVRGKRRCDPKRVFVYVVDPRDADHIAVGAGGERLEMFTCPAYGLSPNGRPKEPEPLYNQVRQLLVTCEF
jgi:hypothetical protein